VRTPNWALLPVLLITAVAIGYFARSEKTNTVTITVVQPDTEGVVAERAPPRFLVKIEFATRSDPGGQATHAEERAVARTLSESPLVSHFVLISKAQALAALKKSEPGLAKSLVFNPLPDSFAVTPKNADDSQKLYRGLSHPLPPGVVSVIASTPTGVHITSRE
jgi:hypothetical protein